tara:strand:- start:115 stop:324 length:210 start_codon:yes stop_codon:yes gene_type:complete
MPSKRSSKSRQDKIKFLDVTQRPAKVVHIHRDDVKFRKLKNGAYQAKAEYDGHYVYTFVKASVARPGRT